MTTFVQMHSEIVKHSGYFRLCGIHISEIITPKLESDSFGDFGKFIIVIQDDVKNETYFIEEVDEACVIRIRGENMVLDIEDSKDVFEYICHNRRWLTRVTKYIQKVMIRMSLFWGE